MTSYDAASTMYLAPRSGATLIITPPTLMGQWERELREKHVDGGGLHSSTSQLNPSRFRHSTHPLNASAPPSPPP